MGGASKIEWCDATFNPWWGCAEVSPGCGHCYARTWANWTRRRGLWPARPSEARDELDMPGHAVMVTSPAYWRTPLKWARLAREGLLPDGTENVDGHRPRIFTASMADVFEDLPELDEPRKRLFDLIDRTPELDWLVLTKRPDVARDWLFRWRNLSPPNPNVWLGVSIENARFTWRADVLREIPAAVRFISAEPLLGSLYPRPTKQKLLHQWEPILSNTANANLEPVQRAQHCSQCDTYSGLVTLMECPGKRHDLDLTGIDWVIIGGESGGGARPFHLEHAREIIRAAHDGCRNCADGVPRVLVGGGESYGYPPIWWHDEGGVAWSCSAHGQRGPAVFVKQLGAMPISDEGAILMTRFPLRDRKGGDIEEWPADLRIREFPRSAVPA